MRIVNHFVILSGGRTSLREVLPQSKDRDYASAKSGSERHFVHSPLGELPTIPLMTQTSMGSFDLKAIRKRMAFGAQDDISEERDAKLG